MNAIPLPQIEHAQPNPAHLELSQKEGECCPGRYPPHIPKAQGNHNFPAGRSIVIDDGSRPHDWQHSDGESAPLRLRVFHGSFVGPAPADHPVQAGYDAFFRRITRNINHHRGDHVHGWRQGASCDGRGETLNAVYPSLFPSIEQAKLTAAQTGTNFDLEKQKEEGHVSEVTEPDPEEIPRRSIHLTWGQARP
jgi:hypothetical protein